MKWPWVSRELYDAGRRERDELHADVLAERAAADAAKLTADARYDALLEKYTEAVRPPVPSLPVMATAVREPRTPDVISKAIREEAGTDTRLAAHLRKRAKELKTEHQDWTPQQIADELSNWQTTANDGIT